MDLLSGFSVERVIDRIAAIALATSFEQRVAFAVLAVIFAYALFSRGIVAGLAAVALVGAGGVVVLRPGAATDAVVVTVAIVAIALVTASRGAAAMRDEVIELRQQILALAGEQERRRLRDLKADRDMPVPPAAPVVSQPVEPLAEDAPSVTPRTMAAATVSPKRTSSVRRPARSSRTAQKEVQAPDGRTDS